MSHAQPELWLITSGSHKCFFVLLNDRLWSCLRSFSSNSWIWRFNKQNKAGWGMFDPTVLVLVFRRRSWSRTGLLKYFSESDGGRGGRGGGRTHPSVVRYLWVFPSSVHPVSILWHWSRAPPSLAPPPLFPGCISWLKSRRPTCQFASSALPLLLLLFLTLSFLCLFNCSSLDFRGNKFPRSSFPKKPFYPPPSSPRSPSAFHFLFVCSIGFPPRCSSSSLFIPHFQRVVCLLTTWRSLQ